MKRFISPAWHDKTVAHQIVQAMGRSADVWLDVNHLQAGDAIQPRMDDAMALGDVVVGVSPDPADGPRISAWCKDYWQGLHPHGAGGACVNFMMDEGAAQCTELKPPPPGRPGEDEAWSGPGHAARSALG